MPNKPLKSFSTIPVIYQKYAIMVQIILKKC